MHDDVMVHVLIGCGCGALLAGVILASVPWAVVGIAAIALALALKERRR